MAAAEGIGALVGTGIIAALSGARALGRLLLALGALLGAALAAFAVAPAFLLATALLVLVGVAYAGLQTLYSALLLRQADRAMSGRVMSIWLVTMGLTPLSALPGGALADLMGARLMMAGTGVLVVLAGAHVRAVQPDRAGGWPNVLAPLWSPRFAGGQGAGTGHALAVVGSPASQGDRAQRAAPLRLGSCLPVSGERV